QATLSEKGTHSLKNISLLFSGDEVILRIEADNAFPCKTFVLTGPDRLVIDLPGVWKGMKTPPLQNNRIIRAVRLGRQSAGPRLVLDLNAALKGHKVERRGNVVDIAVQ
ncbi:MAG: AMIN domain-containing protein, partial [Desulfovibrio sp.]|nr:AMIN domain-containing protein [Desulfovibrio sp.]